MPELQAYLRQALKVRKLGANMYCLREGEICNKIAFIIEGLLKIFHTKDDKEYITWLIRKMM